MRAPLFATSVLWVVITASPGFAADWPTIKVGTEGTFPPWNATNGDGDIVGFEIDLAANLCRRMAAKCRVMPQIWNGMIPALTTGKYDAIMAGMKITKERERLIRFSSCYANMPAIFAAVGESPLARELIGIAKVSLATLEPEDQAAIHELRKTFAGTKIGTLIATAEADFVQQFFGDVVDAQQFDTWETLTADLDAGRIDAVFLPKAVWKNIAKTGAVGDLVPIGPDITGGVLGVGVGVGVRIEDHDLREMFDAAISAAIADGTIARLSKQWFGYDLSC